MEPQTARLQTNKTLRHSRRRALNGMTLVELLVVLAIMAVLAALLLPVFRTSITYAQRTTCMSNMHQCTIALTLYSQDYDDSLPAFRADPLSAMQPDNLVYWHDHFCQGIRLEPHQITWASLASPYAANPSHTTDVSAIFHCPADTDRTARPVTSYEFKMLLADSPNVNQVPEASNMALLWEQWAYHVDAKLSEHDRRAAMNVIFVDNHAHWTRLSDTTTARFGTGPDLHWIFVGTTEASADFNGQDVVAQ